MPQLHLLLIFIISPTFPSHIGQAVLLLCFSTLLLYLEVRTQVIVYFSLCKSIAFSKIKFDLANIKN